MLMAFALAQVLSLLGWAWAAAVSASDPSVWMLALFQQGVEGMASVVLMTLMMDCCRSGHEGSDFTIQASIQLSVTGAFVLVSGVSASWLGYRWHFLLAAILMLTVILQILWLPKCIDEPDHAK
jgi:hypothetical protein